MAKSPTKHELVTMKVMSDRGESATSIAQQLGRSHHTVKKWLTSEAYTDPEINAMVEEIKAAERADLYVLNAKARAHLHVLLDSGTMKPIETIALQDRSFQQRQLLEGKPTEIMSIRSVAAHFTAELEAIRAQREALGHVEIIDDPRSQTDRENND